MNTDNSFDLQQLKAQFDILNRRLDEQAIINENLIRSSVNSRVRNINKDGRTMVGIAVLGAACVVADHYLMNWSWAFTIVTVVFMLVAIVCNILFRQGISSANALSSDLIDMRLRALRLKKMQSRWLWFSIPFLMVWLPWLVCEIQQRTPNPKPIIIGGAIGLVIGGILGVSQYMRTRRHAKEIIRDIESLKGEDPTAQND